MAKFCSKCGAQLEDGVLFCDKCGAKQDGDQENAAPKPEEKAIQPGTVVTPEVGNNETAVAAETEKKAFPTTTVIGIVAVAAVALIVIIILASLLSGGAKSTVKSYLKAFEKGNAKKMLELTIPKDSVEEYIDDLCDMDKKEYIETVDDIYKAMWAALKDEGKVKFDYEIKEVEKINKLDKLKDDVKDIAGTKIKSVKDFADMLDDEDYMDDYDFDADKVKKVYAVEIKYTLEVDGDKQCKSNSEVVLVYKYKGSWYILPEPISYGTVYLSLHDDSGKYDSDTGKTVYDKQDVIDEMDDAMEDLTKAISKKNSD